MKKIESLISFRLMLTGLLTAAVCGTSPPLSAAEAEIGGDSQLLKVPFSDKQTGNLLFRAFEWAIIETNYDEQYHVMRQSPEIEEQLLSNEIDYEIVEGWSVLSTKPSLDLEDWGATDTIPGFDCYGTVEGNYAVAEQLAADYPTLVDWVDIGDSWEKTAGLGGYDMMVLVLSNMLITEVKPKLFLTCAIHAREYATASLCLEFAEGLVDGYGSDADATWLLDHHEVHIMLHANPDGRKQAETGLMWRKNTNQNYCGPTSDLRGADLNRNFDIYWGSTGGGTVECSETYAGVAGASEPETQAIQNYLRSIFPDQRGDDLNDPAPPNATGIYIDFHAYGGEVLYSWGHTATPPANLQGIETLARRLAYWNDYNPARIYGLHPSDGSTADFGYGDLGVASFGFEIGTSFFENCSVFEDEVLPDNLPALRYAAKVAGAPYLTPAGPNTEDVDVSSAAVTAGETVTLTAIVDDTQFNSSVEPIQSIAAAEYYIDTPPFGASPFPVPMAPLDGSFDSDAEAVSATINTGGWEAGRHILFVRGQDSDGKWGVISAVFLTVDTNEAGIVLGFEDETLWTANVTPLTGSSTATEGNQSLSVPASGYVLIESVPINGEGDINAVTVDIMLPSPAANPWWAGQVQLLIEIPSMGIYNFWVAQTELQGLALGTWHTITFNVPDYIGDTLIGQRYDDMVVKFVVNVPQNAGDYLFDNAQIF